MRIEYRIGMYVLGLLVIILLTVYTADMLYFTRFPAVAFFGPWFLVAFMFLDAFIAIAEGKSPQILTNVGHSSINATKDMFDIPWQVEELTDEAKGLNLLNLRIAMGGGVDYFGISTHSSSEKPVFIAPALYFHKEEKNYECYANFERYDMEGLPPYLQYILRKHWPSRFKEKTPIYYSEVSHMDGSATPENMKILHAQRDQNIEDTKYIARIKRLYDELERGEKHKNRIFFKRELEEVDEERPQ